MPRTKKAVKPINMEPAPRKPMKTAPYILKILQKIMNKRRWIITLQMRNQEWEPLGKHKS